MNKHKMCQALLRALALQLYRWAEAIWVSLAKEEKALTQDTDATQLWQEQVTTQPPADWLERVRQGAPELLKSPDQSAVPLQKVAGNPTETTPIPPEDYRIEGARSREQGAGREEITSVILEREESKLHPNTEFIHDVAREQEAGKPLLRRVPLPSNKWHNPKGYKGDRFESLNETQYEAFPQSGAAYSPRQPIPLQTPGNFRVSVDKPSEDRVIFPAPSSCQDLPPENSRPTARSAEAKRNNPATLRIEPLKVNSPSEEQQQASPKSFLRVEQTFSNTLAAEFYPFANEAPSALEGQFPRSETELIEQGQPNAEAESVLRIQSSMPRTSSKPRENHLLSPLLENSELASSCPKPSPKTEPTFKYHTLNKQNHSNLDFAPRTNHPLLAQSIGTYQQLYRETETKPLRFFTFSPAAPCSPPPASQFLTPPSPDCWPELPEVVEFSEKQDWNHALRQQEHQQRLEREQRGELWL
ncbi:MAG: hypothetical protein AB4426_02315 [Xenococcaceae cyanobacterium]